MLDSIEMQKTVCCFVINRLQIIIIIIISGFIGKISFLCTTSMKSDNNKEPGKPKISTSSNLKN